MDPTQYPQGLHAHASIQSPDFQDVPGLPTRIAFHRDQLRRYLPRGSLFLPVKRIICTQIIIEWTGYTPYYFSIDYDGPPSWENILPHIHQKFTTWLSSVQEQRLRCPDHRFDVTFFPASQYSYETVRKLTLEDIRITGLFILKDGSLVPEFMVERLARDEAQN
ncbi:hypothetical protein DL96DRAFT_1709052 [Flagelloscypha sp. PMI_526]|nr:hypothetical protein DL96DRAFT_1709052 [Flagelloscypha sp. PMI_526]